MIKDWVLKESGRNEKSLVKRLLISRGITKDEDIKDFLNPLEMELTSPYVFCDMEKAVERLSRAIDNKECIVIYGDFDADGVTSTSVLYKTLKFLNAEVHYFIPNRETEGHGLDSKAIIKLMTTVKPKVLITVDCGISNIEEVKFINSFRTMDVIITDHHEAPEILPEAYAIINPKAQNSLSDKLSSKQIEYLTYLAGCGVALKVAQALLTKYNKPEFIYEILPFSAIGTIADIVPLLGENRYIVTKGLDLISKGKHEGIKKLLESAGYDITNGITSEQIAFGIAPRINASGRLDTVESALKVLISDNMSEVQMAITTLNDLNTIRQKLCQEVFEQADEMVKKEGNKNPAIVLCSKDWHIGIIGIVASKLVEKYYKPVFLMSYIEETNQYRCSARSIEGINLYEVIKANAELLDNFGGHTMAAGLGFSGEKSSFESVKKALCDTVKEFSQGKELKPFVEIDLKLEPQDITLDLIEEISKLEPFGACNPSPVFELDNTIVSQKKLMGSDNSHLRLILNKDGREFTSVWWSKGDISLFQGDSADIAFHPQLNTFNGNTSVQLIIDDIHSESLTLAENEVKHKYKIYDNRSKHNIYPQVNDYLKNTKLNIGVFAESKYVIDELKPYKEIYSKIFSRENISNYDVIMFFDYPADKETFENILISSGTKGIHFMSYEPKFNEEEEILKTFAGMIKFAFAHNLGKVELIRCASFLELSVDTIEKLLILFENCGFIKIKNKNEKYYEIELFEINDLTKVLHNPLYGEISDKIDSCKEFLQTLLEDNLEKICTIEG